MNKKQVYAGWGISGVVALVMVGSGGMKLLGGEAIRVSMMKFGYPEGLAPFLGILELIIITLYGIDRTRLLGGILLTGYLGGAVATHVRVGENFLFPLTLGALAWVGLWIHETRLRTLLPVDCNVKG